MTIINKSSEEIVIRDEYKYFQEFTAKTQGRSLIFEFMYPTLEFGNGREKPGINVETSIVRDDVLELLTWICEYYKGYFENYPQVIPDIIKYIGQIKDKNDNNLV
jgi:hypothetical protein